jgi:AraC-like DNA-binding protein
MKIGSVAKKQSILGLIPLFNAVEELGVDPEEILRRRGMSLQNMSGAAVIDQSLELDIVSEAIDLLNDPILGVKVGSQVTFTSYGTYAMLLMSAPNFDQALKVGAQFQALSLLFSHMTLHFDKDWIELRYTLPEASTKLRSFIADRDLMGTYIFVREFIAKPNEILLGAGTARPKPTGKSLVEYQKYIDFDLQFDQPYNWFRLPRAILSVAMKHGNQLAHRLYRVQAYELLRKFYSHDEDIVSQTRQIIEGYEGHFPSVPDIANMFGVSERTFRRRLSAANTSYQALLDEHKKQRCLGMMAAGSVSVGSLAESLGYAESASFLRAFKRWTDCTPKEYLRRIAS